jgi:hypothetical protein
MTQHLLPRAWPQRNVCLYVSVRCSPSRQRCGHHVGYCLCVKSAARSLAHARFIKLPHSSHTVCAVVHTHPVTCMCRQHQKWSSPACVPIEWRVSVWSHVYVCDSPATFCPSVPPRTIDCALSKIRHFNGCQLLFHATTPHPTRSHMSCCFLHNTPCTTPRTLCSESLHPQWPRLRLLGPTVENGRLAGDGCQTHPHGRQARRWPCGGAVCVVRTRLDRHATRGLAQARGHARG